MRLNSRNSNDLWILLKILTMVAGQEARRKRGSDPVWMLPRFLHGSLAP